MKFSSSSSSSVALFSNFPNMKMYIHCSKHHTLASTHRIGIDSFPKKMEAKNKKKYSKRKDIKKESYRSTELKQAHMEITWLFVVCHVGQICE